MEQIHLNDEEGSLSFYVVEQTILNGKTYLLVTTQEEGDAEAYILRDDSKETDAEALYSFVEEEAEIDAVGGIFQKLLDEEDIGLSTGG